jgi:hypothetical protein
MTGPSPMLSVYDGQTCRGFILLRGRAGFEAYDCDEKLLGTFKTQREAANVIMGSPR